MSTHILAPTLSEIAVREALRSGHAYVSHDWMCDPSGFRFELLSSIELGKNANIDADARRQWILGDETKLSDGLRLRAEFPVACHIRLLEAGNVVAEQAGDRLEYDVTRPGVYRVEGWLESGGEKRGWIYSNPVYVR